MEISRYAYKCRYRQKDIIRYAQMQIYTNGDKYL